MYTCNFNPLGCRGNYSATSNNIKYLLQRGGYWVGPQPAQAPPRCTECNSPAINDQCTNHRSALCIRRTRTADVDADIKMTIGIPIVTGLPRLPTVYQSSKTVKRQSKQQKMTIGVPIVTCLHRLRRIHKTRSGKAERSLLCIRLMHACNCCADYSTVRKLGFGLGDVTFFRRSLSISIPNFVGITQSTDDKLFPVWKNKRPPY